jgi:hypothetical protein
LRQGSTQLNHYGEYPMIVFHPRSAQVMPSWIYGHRGSAVQKVDQTRIMMRIIRYLLA